MAPKVPRNTPQPKPRTEDELNTQGKIVEGADQPSTDRDLVDGDGGTFELPVKPGDISKDD